MVQLQRTYRPVRSYEKLRGLDKLTASERDRCTLGNIFADFTWEVIEIAIDVEISFLLLEQLEDLGRGPYRDLLAWPSIAR